MALTVHRTDDAGLRVVRLAGDLDLASAAQADAGLTEAATPAPATLLVDLAGVHFCDSTGLGVLVRAFKRVRAAGGQFCLVGAGGMMMRILDTTQLTRVIPVYATVADAAAHRADAGDWTAEGTSSSAAGKWS